MQQGKRSHKQSKGRQEDFYGRIGGEFVRAVSPEYIQHRLALFKQLYEAQEERIEALEKPEIVIILPDGSEHPGRAFETSPLDIAKQISKDLSKQVVAAKVIYSNNLELEQAPEDLENPDLHNVYDLCRPLEADCSLEFIHFEDPLGKEVFWHSSAHLLGEALEQLYGIHLAHGPALELGFFYDFYMGDDHVSQDNFKEIEKAVNKSVKRNDKFLRLELSKEQALEMFKHNPFKVSYIQSKIPDGAMASVYRSGSLIDLCQGPHLPSAGRVKGFKLVKCSASNWNGDIRNDSLQRIYGVSFPSKEQLSEHLKEQEELAKRNHRLIGEQQKLFSFTKYSPGGAFFLPHGVVVFNKLLAMIRNENRARGFREVITPCMNLNSLWKTSGHFFKYRADMFYVNADEGQFGLKPMNCPAHCAIFNMHQVSYRDLPVRMADFGVLHRNEASGALGGLTRVRKFQQDDAHVFCSEDQIDSEIAGILDYLKYVYGVLNLPFELELSTRPEERCGSDEVWDRAEAALEKVLHQAGLEYTLGEGEGAFYGPKIDIKVKDGLGRKHQLGTIQLDFNLPERFNLQYRDKEVAESEQHLDDDALEARVKEIKEHDIENMKKRAEKRNISLEGMEEVGDYQICGKLKKGFKRPVVIHKAVLGSLERCIALLTENYAGKWPFWLSPRQAIVIPISKKYMDYAQRVKNRLFCEGYEVFLDSSSANIKKKVRSAQLEGYNYILVVGEKEMNEGSVAVRVRDGKEPIGSMNFKELSELFKSLQPKESNAWANLRSDSSF